MSREEKVEGPGISTNGSEELVLDQATAEYFNDIEGGRLDLVSRTLLNEHNHDDDYEGVSAASRNLTGETGLIVACRLGLVELVEFFCSLDDTDLDACDNEYWSALLNAARSGYLKIVKTLLDNDADIEQTDGLGWTAVSWAAYKDRVDVLKLLLELGASPHIIDDDGMTTLAWACGRGHTEIVRSLLEQNIDVNTSDKFGSSPLLWACRKGYAEIVESLLSASADVNSAGMYSSTPLILATRGNYADVVDLLLQHEPNVNAVDEDGCTALSLAAREGYFEIGKALLESGAYVNVTDRRGDTVLSAAVKGGHLDIVRALLDSYADVNARGQEDGRTALHLAVDKGYTDILVALLESRPNLELRTKEGDSPLLRAVRNRNALMVQLLVRSGAKVSTADSKGDNGLHLSLRARSKRITQVLLTRPKDARLLYRPNSEGETPYSIDQSHAEPILPHIFGPVESQTQTEAMMGYDIYSNVLADILCEPNLSLPLNIGLYAKWGSGKSFLLNKMKEAMGLFSRSWLDSVELGWSWSVVGIVVFLGCFLAVLVYAPSLDRLTLVEWIPALCVGLVFDLVLIGSYGLLYYGSQVRNWTRFVNWGSEMGRAVEKWKVLARVLFYHPPTLQEKDFLACPVSFLFSDYHRLSSVGGEQALAKIVTTLITAVEKHYGKCTSRLCGALRPEHARGSKARMKRVCGVPILFLFVGVWVCFLLACFLFAHSGHLYYSMKENKKNDKVGITEDSSAMASLLSASGLLTVVLLLSTYPVYVVVTNCVTSAPRRRLMKAIRRLDKLRFEGFMQLLQQEVDGISDMICSLDGFTQSQTRLVVFVDGLDNCEQERMVQTLDALELLFCCRQRRPFIVIIAVDPHIIISAINHNIRSALSGTELSGHDYLKNMVHMPFYLQNSALRRLQEKLRQRAESLEQWKSRFLRQETLYGSYLSLNESGSRLKKVVSQHLAGNPGIGLSNLSQTIVRDDYFSNLNPRSMKRIMNTLNLTGRLMRAFEVEFSWVLLGQWLSLVEQWPYRISWIIDYCEETDGIVDAVSLKEIYDIVKDRIPVLRTEDRLVDIDRNPHNLDMHLAAAYIRGEKILTVGHLRSFVPCTSNLDPYIRKLIKERRLAAENPGGNFLPRTSFLNAESFYVGEGLAPPRSRLSSPHLHADTVYSSVPGGPAADLFPDRGTWSNLKRLSSLSPSQVAELVKLSNVSEGKKEVYGKRIIESNLSGLVLSICDLDDVKKELQMTLGDWTLFKLLIETLRERNRLGSPDRDRPLEVETNPAESNSVDPSPRSLDSRGTRRRGNFASGGRAPSIEQKEAEAHSQWLEERFGKLDSTEFSGDMEIFDRMSSVTNHTDHSTRSSVVQFAIDTVEIDEIQKPADRDLETGLNDAASSKDSTTSMFGSQGNLLELKRSRLRVSETEDTPELLSGEKFSSNWSSRKTEVVRVTEDDDILVEPKQHKSSLKRSSVSNSRSPSLKGKPSASTSASSSSRKGAEKPNLPSPSEVPARKMETEEKGEGEHDVSVEDLISETESEENQLTVKFCPQGGKGAEETRPSLFDIIGASGAEPT